jgi:cytochrome c peroxidase
MSKSIIISTITLLIILLLSSFDEQTIYTLPTPKGWKKPAYNFDKNPLNVNKIVLGRALFYEPKLSKDNTISCASCHSLYNAFTHVDHPVSHGIDDMIGTRNSPTLMNLAWHKSFMWDGAINHLDVQALAPITNPIEMNEDIDNIIKKLKKDTKYKIAFQKAYNDTNITGEYILKAISQFSLTLISANSKYDKVMHGEDKFTPQEQKGYRIFKKNCSSCHTEPLFTNLNFENNGLPVDTQYNDYGRMDITHNKRDSLKFKVPTLRNIEFSYPYMHDGRFENLKAVFNHYDQGIVKSNTLSKQLKASIILTSNERVDLTAFLLTLTDKEFLFNTDFGYPKEFFK